MSFGEQIAHIAGGNYSYCARMTNSKSPFAKPEKADKETAMKLVGESFDYCAGIVSGLTDDQLERDARTRRPPDERSRAEFGRLKRTWPTTAAKPRFICVSRASSHRSTNSKLAPPVRFTSLLFCWSLKEL